MRNDHNFGVNNDAPNIDINGRTQPARIYLIPDGDEIVWHEDPTSDELQGEIVEYVRADLAGVISSRESRGSRD